jgi:hypothetical protein
VISQEVLLGCDIRPGLLSELRYSTWYSTFIFGALLRLEVNISGVQE